MKIVLFAGGVGSRLWPLSRKNKPKQFGRIIANRSMLQIAVHKLFPEFAWEDVFISTGKAFADTVREQLPQLPKDNIIVEPEMRDVGPAVGLVIAQFIKRFPNEPVVLLWGSDHLIKKESLFRKTLRAAEGIIVNDPNKIVFIGQKPRFANQNVGYIEFGGELKVKNGIQVYAFKDFQYAPPLDVAEEFANDNQHAWNLGYFATSPAFLWEQFEKFAPDLFSKLKKISDAYGSENYESVINDVYPSMEKISFDHAILEKIDRSSGMVLSVDLGWSDIGAWEAMKEALSKTEAENVTKGKIVLTDCRDSILHNETSQLIVGIDLDGLVVVNTEDVILVCPKESVPKIKKFVTGLKGTKYEYLA